MALDTVKEEIIASAKAEMKKIVAAAKHDAKQFVAAAEAEAVQLEKRMEEEILAQEQLLKTKATAALALELKKLHFEKKKELLEAVYAQALQRLNRLEQGKKREILQKLLKKASRELAFAVLFCNPVDVRFFSQLVQSRQFNLVECCVEPFEDIKSGFIVENKQSTVRVDYTFQTLFTQLKEQSLQEVAKILFP